MAERMFDTIADLDEFVDVAQLSYLSAHQSEQVPRAVLARLERRAESTYYHIVREAHHDNATY